MTTRSLVSLYVMPVRTLLKRFSALGILVGTLSWSQTPVVTWHYDNARSGADITEVQLTPSNVNPNSFGKLVTLPVDGLIIGHPLYLPNVSIPNVGTRSVVYVATMHDTVYAFDANGGNAPPLWSTSLLTYSPSGATTVPISVKGCQPTVAWTETGVISTPVIDPNSGTIYLVAETYESGSVVHRIHALDVTTGKEQTGWPVTIAAEYTVTVNGTQKKSVFVDTHQMNRPGLLLSNGHLYIAFGGPSCNTGGSGWVMSYNVSNGQQEGAFTVEPGSQPGTGLASIWQKGAGISADAEGYVYAETGEAVLPGGDGVPGTNLANSVFKLSQVGTTLSLTDWFLPYNYMTLNQNDLDLNNAVVLLPDQNGSAHPHEAITLGKEGTIYVIDRDTMGHSCLPGCTSSDTQLPQELPSVATEAFTPVVWKSNGWLVYITGSAKVQVFSLANGALTLQNSIVVGATTHPVVTANGSNNGILWFINGAALVARNANTLAPLYSTRQAANGRDTLPPTAHFASPIVADGKVFVGTQNSLVIYGLLPSLSVAGGNKQSGTVGSRLSTSLQVQAGSASQPLSGLTVNFSDGGKGGVFGTPSGVTGANGTISTTYTLPTKTGTYSIAASAANLGPALFSETATVGAPASLARLSGAAQSATVTTAFAQPLVAWVKDKYGNGVPGVQVTFADGGRGGTFNLNPVPTDPKGRASVTYTEGTKSGSITVTATVSGLPTLAFAETATAGPAAALVVVSGNGQTAPVSTQLPEPLIVRVTDQYGNPVIGANVQFTDGGVGGSFSSGPFSTGTTGTASANYITPPNPGSVTVQAMVAGVSGPAVFNVQVQ